MKTTLARACVCLLWLATAFTLRAQSPAYTVVDLGAVGASGNGVQAINNLGQIVGSSSFTIGGLGFATLFSVALDGTVTRTNLGSVDGRYSGVAAINDAGLIAGFSSTANNNQAALFQVTGGSVTLTNLEPNPGSNNSSASGIDSAGTIVGTRSSTVGQGSSALTWTVNGSTVTRTPFSNGNSGANAISPSGGYIVGSAGTSTISQAIRFAPGNLSLGSLGGYNSGARDVNTSGFIVGSSELTPSVSTYHAATFSVDGSTVTRTDLGTLGGANSSAYSVNVFGQITGSSQYTGGGATFAAFVYTAGGGMQNLNNLVGTNPVATALGASGFVTHGINDWGQIITNGTVGGQTHGVLLNPVTPNSTLSGFFGAYRNTKLVAGKSYGVVPATTNTAGLASTVSLLDGVAGSGGLGTYGLNRDVGEQFGSGNITGVPLASSGVLITGTGADTYVVQLSYSESAAASAVGATSENDLRLCYFSAGTRLLNAVDGNVGGTPLFAGVRAYNPATDLHLGTYGIDTVNNVAWAVVNQENSYVVSLDPDVLKRVKTVSRSGTTTTITVDSYTGHPYQLQRATSPAGPWTNNGSALMGSNGTTLTFSVNEGTTAKAFYRLLVGP